jgi:hypothetical protein
MRTNVRKLVPVLWPLCLACGGSSSHGTAAVKGDSGSDAMMAMEPDGGGGMDSASSHPDSAAGMDSATGMDSTAVAMDSSMPTGGDAMSGPVPAPGSVDNVDNNFGDVEPNNTPSEATPLGTAMGADVNVWVNGNNIGGPGNPADYFVFGTSAMAGQFTFDICFAAPTTAMTATLWMVVNSVEQQPPVGSWTSSSTCVTDMTPAPLEASSVYLFALTATGGAGMYSA